MSDELLNRARELLALREKATPIEGAVFNRYGHGGGRLYNERADLLAAAGAVTEAEHTEILSAPPAPAVPDGWKLVPARSTLEWVEAVAERGLKIGSVAGVIESVLAAAPEVKP